MSSLAVHSTHLTIRSLRQLWRQPAFVVVTLVQPAVWMFLFGQLFKNIVEIPGFAAPGVSYLEFLTPGVIAMTTLFSAGWAGDVYIQDMERGVMDRLLASPVRRGAMINGTLAYQSIVTIIQSVIIVAMAYLGGARFAGGAAGVAMTLLAAVLLTLVFAALSDAVALLVHQHEALIGISQLVSLPLAFVSSAIMDLRIAPGWIRTVATYNPLDWCVVVSRQALSGAPDWGAVWPRLGALVGLAFVMGWLATLAFRTYQRSV